MENTIAEETGNQQTGEWSADSLNRLSRKELFELFHSWPAPTMAEMDGEYRASVIHHGSAIYRLLSALTVANPFLEGTWLNKSFQPFDKSYGHGYNTFKKFNKTIRKYPMKTSIGRSRYDGQPIYQLDYTAFATTLGRINMVDEIRKLDSTHFLGIGTAGFTAKQRQIPMPFLLVGPYQGFVGTDKTYREKQPRFTQ